MPLSLLIASYFVSKTAQLGVPFSLPPYLLPVVFDYFLLKKLRKLSFLLGLMGVYLLFFHKYLSPYLSPKKIMTCKSSRYTGHCGEDEIRTHDLLTASQAL